MATTEVIFSPPLVQSKPAHHPYPQSATAAGALSSFRIGRAHDDE
jgi:hypothetical protein